MNVCGKIELLHAVLSLNKQVGVDSSATVTFIDVGSLHGLQAAPGRSLYGSSKSMGLDLCLSLQFGQELKRVIYMVPGPIDTHMLHRNYWVSKEHGPVEFFEHVRTAFPDLYAAIFLDCDPSALRVAASRSGVDVVRVTDVFHRYKDRRAQQCASSDGILQPAELADALVDIMTDESKYPEGAYILPRRAEACEWRE